MYIFNFWKCYKSSKQKKEEDVLVFILYISHSCILMFSKNDMQETHEKKSMW